LVKLLVEATKSRTNLHAARKLAIVFLPSGNYEVYEKPEIKGKGTYARGVAGYVSLNPPKGSLISHVNLVLNPRRRVSGRIRVYSSEGLLVLEAVLRKRKVRRVRGDPSYRWVIERTLRILGLESHVRRYNWRTGAP